MYERRFFECFSILEDTREQGEVRYKLIDIIFIVVVMNGRKYSGGNQSRQILTGLKSILRFLMEYPYYELLEDSLTLFL